MKILSTFVFAAFLFSIPFVSFAQSISVELESSSDVVRVGEEILLRLVLENPGKIELNTIKATIVVPKRDFEIENFWFENSLVPLWIDDPAITETDSAFLLTFTGLIPGGTDKSGDLVTIILRALEGEGQSSIRMIDVSAYQHSKQAELISLPEQYAFISLLAPDNSSVPQQDLVLRDLEPPEDFFPIVAKSTELFDGDYFLMFHTIDRQTGVDRFEILESESFYDESTLAEEGRLYWRAAENPARLSDQTLSSYLYVRAYDNAGNSRTVIIPPTSFVESVGFWNIINRVTRLVVVVLLMGGVFLFIRKKRQVPNEDLSTDI